MVLAQDILDKFVIWQTYISDVTQIHAGQPRFQTAISCVYPCPFYHQYDICIHQNDVYIHQYDVCIILVYCG